MAIDGNSPLTEKQYARAIFSVSYHEDGRLESATGDKKFVQTIVALDTLKSASHWLERHKLLATLIHIAFAYMFNTKP